MAVYHCGLALILIIGPHYVFSSSHCVMYGFCGENDYGMATCSYNGTAIALDDEEALEILQEICPDVLRENNLLCCSKEQVIQLKDNLEVAATLGLAQHPSCLSNFRKNFCQLECSANQSDFLKVTELAISDEDDLVIGKISYYMSDHYADGMFASCKNIRGLTPNSTVLDIMCGGWGRDCSAERWLNFMGSTPDNNGFSPIEINYHLTSENYVIVDGETFVPMNESITSDMLEKVNKFEEQFTSNSASLDSPLRVNKLQPLAENSGSCKLLQMEIDRLRAENKKISETLKEVENHVIEILEQKSAALSESLIQAQNELKEWKERKVLTIF